MADRTITQLPQITTANGGERIPVVFAGNSRSLTVDRIKSYVMTQPNIIAALGFTPANAAAIGDIEAALNAINGE